MASKRRGSTVPFEHIVADEEFNCRKTYNNIDTLAKSILDDGLLQPLGVTARTGEDGIEKYFLVYGFRRYRAIAQIRKQHGDEYYASVDVMFHEGTFEELRFKNLKENIDRDHLSSYEISRQVLRMVNAGMDQRDIATRLGRNQSWVSIHYKAATQLSIAGQNALKDGDLTMELALQLADVTEEKQREVLDRALQAETKAETKQIIKQAASESGKRRKYSNRGRPSAKNLLELVSTISYEAQNAQRTEDEQRFFNGVAAGIRIALGDEAVDSRSLDAMQTYADLNYHRRNAKDPGEVEAAETTETPEAETEEGLDSDDAAHLLPYQLPGTEAAVDTSDGDAVYEETETELVYSYKEPLKTLQPEPIKGVDDNLQPAKRKRGRPRKHPAPEA